MSILKSQRFGLVLTIAEKMAIRQLAELEGGLTQGALVRCLIREAAQKKGIWEKQDESALTTSEITPDHKEGNDLAISISEQVHS